MQCPNSRIIHKLLNPPQNVPNIEELVLFGAILREKIWQARNMKVFEGVEPCFESIKSMLARTMSEHSSTISLPRLQQKPRRSVSWVRQEEGAIKFNVDAAMGLVYSVVAVVVRDWRGTLLFAGSKKLNTSLPLQAEAEALKWAVALAAALSCNDAVFERDSQGCIQAICCNRLEIHWRVKNVLEEIIKLAKSIPNSSFCWSPRDANRAAHSLAKLCLRSKVIGYFDLWNCPPYFVNVIREEAVSVVIVWFSLLLLE